MSSNTVLVCDDAVFMRTMVSDILSQAGFTVVGEAENGKQAVEKYQQLKPDLVTMDIIMPEMGGIEAVKQITQMDPAARILMCSAMGSRRWCRKHFKRERATSWSSRSSPAAFSKRCSGCWPRWTSAATPNFFSRRAAKTSPR